MGGFLELCYNPSSAAEVTLQPIRRFGFDAAIIFSDILVIPHSLGLDVRFEQGEGPRVEKVCSNDLNRLKIDPNEAKLQKVYEAIALVKSDLPKDKTLIGFVGGAWTVATYMLEGRGKHDFTYSRKIAYSDPKFLHSLIDIISEQTTHHILGQIKAGAEVIQIFDSWAGVLGGYEFDEFVIKPAAKIITEVKKHYPDIPIIGFPRGAGLLYEKFIEGTGIDGVGVDQTVPISHMSGWGENVVVQGNIDPVVLLSNKEAICQKVDEIMDNRPRKFIFNLGHGILPETPIENVEFLVEYLRSK